MTINYIEVGRDKRSWSKTFASEVSEDEIAIEAKRGGRLMSSCVHAEFNDSANGGLIVVGGFRTVGTFTISNQ
jgi:hypothetical protein